MKYLQIPFDFLHGLCRTKISSDAKIKPNTILKYNSKIDRKFLVKTMTTNSYVID